MKSGRRARAAALGMAVLLCLSNLTPGAGMDMENGGGAELVTAGEECAEYAECAEYEECAEYAECAEYEECAETVSETMSDTVLSDSGAGVGGIFAASEETAVIAGDGTGVPGGEGTGVPGSEGTGVPGGEGTGVPAGDGTGVPGGDGTGVPVDDGAGISESGSAAQGCEGTDPAGNEGTGAPCGDSAGSAGSESTDVSSAEGAGTSGGDGNGSAGNEGAGASGANSAGSAGIESTDASGGEGAGTAGGENNGSAGNEGAGAPVGDNTGSAGSEGAGVSDGAETGSSASGGSGASVSGGSGASGSGDAGASGSGSAGTGTAGSVSGSEGSASDMTGPAVSPDPGENASGSGDAGLPIDCGTDGILIIDDTDTGTTQTELDAILAGPVELNDQINAGKSGELNKDTQSTDRAANNADTDSGDPSLLIGNSEGSKADASGSQTSSLGNEGAGKAGSDSASLNGTDPGAEDPGLTGSKSDGLENNDSESDTSKSNESKSDGSESDGSESDGPESDGSESDGSESDGSVSDGSKDAGSDTETSSAQEESEQEESETEYMYEDSMSLEDLKSLPMDEAGAATEVSRRLMAASGRYRLMASASGARGLWSCSDYYVNEQDLHSVSKEDDFSLKVQVEFHTSTQLEKGNVEIRLPESFITNRFGNGIVPSQIGVPAGTREEFCESLNSPFNWYKDETTGELVFFNYRPIASGTNTAFQILYHPILIMELRDQTSWSLTPTVSVTLQDQTTQEQQMDELKGIVDSSAQILNVSASAYSDGTISCMPALYTKDQVARVLGSQVPAFLAQEEGEWLYLVWQIDSMGEYDQPWDLHMDAELSADGLSGDGDMCVVGSVTGITGMTEGDGSRKNVIRRYMASEKGTALADISSEDLSSYMQKGTFHLSTLAVTAVKKSVLKNGDSVLSLKPNATLTPRDGIDPATSADGNASWTYVDYTWKYKGDDVGIGAWSGERSSDGSVSYSMHQTDYPGWINEYQIAGESQKSAGSVPFRIQSECRGYSYTHETGGTLAGTYISGTGYEVTTVDDVVYAVSAGDDGNSSGIRLMDQKDYYYSSVSVSVKDRGMDIFEDRVTDPMSEEECAGADRSTVIYALYADSSDWEIAAQCPWDGSGKVTYSFTKEQISRRPWRVKVVHNAVDYDSTCVIDSDLCIRPDSPVMKEYLKAQDSGNSTFVKVEHLGSVLARSTGGEESGEGWFHDTREDGAENYSEPGLSDLTRSLYGVLSMRANSFAQLTELKKHAKALKTVSRENDPSAGCIHLTYNIGALEGYRIYSQNAADRIAKGKTSFPAPDRSQYVIYDLLPEGVILDPSVPMKAGLVMGTAEKYLVTPSLWKGKDVSVHVDPDHGVISDWKHTGRTMVILQVYIALDEPLIPRMCDGMWMNGIGVQFGAYVPYRDLKRMKEMPNIAAVMPGEGKDDPAEQIIGTDEEVACDDGVVVPYGEDEKKEFSAFGADIDSDGVTDKRCVLYAYALSQGDDAINLTDSLTLTVKADKENFVDEGRRAVVGAGDPYTYRIDVANSSTPPVSEIVIAEHLELGREERTHAESGREFDEESWQGSLVSVDTEDAARQGIRVKTYVSADAQAPLPGEGNSPDKVLTQENGWILLDDWTEDMSKVRSVAVDLRKTTDGGDFVLNQGDSVHIRLHMQAPQIGDGEGETRAEHAYHCASFYSISPEEPDGDLVTCDAVEVTLKERCVLIVEKELQNEVPSGNGSETFLFRLSRDSEALGLRPYKLEEKKENDSGEMVWVDDKDLHTTGKEGYFTLHAGQRAVFENEPGAKELVCEEIRSACYEVQQTEEDTSQGHLCRFDNTWYPTLYLRKKVYSAPEGQELSEDVFRVRVKADSKSLAGEPYWTVDPDQGLVENEVIEEHMVDEDSCVLLHAGEVIALHPGNAQCTYEVCEDDSCFGPASDYVAVTSQKSGILGEEGSSVLLENAWKWKDLILQKQVLYKEQVPDSDLFTFRLWRMKEGKEAVEFDPEDPESSAEPVPHARCRMENENFETDDNGCFSCACAGKDVVIEHLEARGIYVIQETQMPQFYEAVDGGIVSVQMPVLGDRRYAGITNSWKKRSLEVSKSVLSGTYGRRTTVFSPQFPGAVPYNNDRVSLLDFQDSQMTGFRLEFPREIDLTSRAILEINTEQGSAETMSGTIAAGTVKTFTGHTAASINFLENTQFYLDGFFFYFTPIFAEPAQSQADQSERSFTFLLETGDENGQMRPAGNVPYKLSAGEALQTDENGMFQLSAGMSAVFTDLDVEGTKWRVTETPDPSCPQAYPAGGRPAEGTLGDGGADVSHALFINGEDCQGMIRKRFCAAEGDESAAQFVESERNRGSATILRSVFKIEVEDDSGAYIPLNGEIEVADSSEGMLLHSEIRDGIICLSESQTAIISGLSAGRKWKVEELESGLIRQGDTVYGSECIQPGQSRTSGGTAGEKVTEAEFVNEIHSVSIVKADLITKEFKSGENGWERVPGGAVLAFILERYENGRWKSACGVNWVQCLNSIPYGSAFHQTAEDGVIRVAKEDTPISISGKNVYLIPIAIDDGNVKTELYYTQHEAREGDMRIREALDLSDPSYGMLVDGGDHSFINENETQKLVVEKQTSAPTDLRFTMQMVQKIADTDLPGRYLPYEIIDAQTGESKGSGRTDEQGCFRIHASEQAVFDLAEGSDWTVTEKNSCGWKLSSCVIENKTLDPAETDRGISFHILSIRNNVAFTSQMLSEDLRDPATGQVLDLTADSITIPHYVEKDGQIMEITSIAEDAFAQTAYQEVKIAEGIREIGARAFDGCENLSTVLLPQSLEIMGEACLRCTPVSRLEIPSGVRKAGEDITCWCMNLSEIIIHQKKEMSPFCDYKWKTYTNTNVVFSD